MKQILLNEIIEYGLHDSCIVKFTIDFKYSMIRLYIRTSCRSFRIDCMYIEYFSGIGFDEKNMPVILDYSLTDKRIKIFTTLSEWIDIFAKKILIYEL